MHELRLGADVLLRQQQNISESYYVIIHKNRSRLSTTPYRPTRLTNEIVTSYSSDWEGYGEGPCMVFLDRFGENEQQKSA